MLPSDLDPSRTCYSTEVLVDGLEELFEESSSEGRFPEEDERENRKMRSINNNVY